MTKSTGKLYPSTWVPITIRPVINARSESLYGMWRMMIHRCYNPRNAKFANYGGRGIHVAERWHDFSAFKLDMSPRPDGHLIERKDNNGHYEPLNRIWATPKQQNRNKRNIKHHGLAEKVFLLKASGMGRKDIVTQTNVNVATIKAILSGRQWA